jgi:pyruvate/2-oxoglutarate dehydrogenase complex dihydrolipoamide dehydrogenase (E3) component
MNRRFDAVVIGTGQAGPSLAAKLAAAGKKTAIIERHRYGGTCVNNGCMPTKTLVASAYAAHLARRAAEYGVVIDGPVRIDMKRVKARKDEVAGAASRNVEKWLKGVPNLTVIEGHARFASPASVSVNNDIIEAGQFFINVGGRALAPPMPGLDQAPYLTNSTIMDVDFVPEHLLIIGGSYIGLEFGQIYRRFGARVTLIEKAPQIIGREDAEVSQAIRDILSKEGIAIETGAEFLSVEKRGERIAVKLDCGGEARRVEGSHLLMAVGRVPNTDDLGLDRAGVKTDARGYIVVDSRLNTNVRGIWAIGDCNGRGAFTHTSYNDYEIVAGNLLDGALNGEQRSIDDRLTAYGLFTDPPLARVGLTDNEIRKSGRRALTGKRPMTRVGRE